MYMPTFMSMLHSFFPSFLTFFHPSFLPSRFNSCNHLDIRLSINAIISSCFHQSNIHYLSIHSSIHICLSTFPSIHLSIYIYIHFHPSIHPSKQTLICNEMSRKDYMYKPQCIICKFIYDTHDIIKPTV